jgi:hypothetical protein
MVEVADGFDPRVNPVPVGRAPTSRGIGGDIGSYHMGVQLGVAGARASVGEGRAHDAFCLHYFPAPSPSPCSHRFGFHGRDGLADSIVVGSGDGVGQFRRRQGPGHRDRLGRTETQVEAGHSFG